MKIHSEKKGSVTTAETVQYLTSLGVSDDASKMYLLLLKSKAMTIHELADKLGNLPSANYRLAYELEELGLIFRIYGRPMRFQAYPFGLGIQSSFNKHRTTVEGLVGNLLGNTDLTHHHVELLVGRQMLYDKYEQLASKACQEIAVYSIGIAYSKSLHFTQKSALKRGVVIRHVVQRVKSDNYHIIHKWQELGVQIRHAPADRGFHLMVFDRSQVLVSFSDPENTDSRISILTDSPAATGLFLTQFENIWKEAKILPV